MRYGSVISIIWETILKPLALSIALLLAACTTTRTVYVTPPPHPAPSVQQTTSVITVYEEPPMSQPAPIAIRWAPPPMLVEVPPPSPNPGSVWVGGYWTWNGTWVWAHGRWAQPPRSGYYWVHPYYENRNGEVVFVTGYWSPPEVMFVPPPPTVHIIAARVASNVVPGSPPIGPSGVFVPAPPGSRIGIIVPAPLGTPPAVVTSVPPVVNVGMHIEHNTDIHNTTINKTVTNNINNVHNVANITNVTIVAPPSAVASGQAVKAVVPAQAHLAAALPAADYMRAPEPVTNKKILTEIAAPPPAIIFRTPRTAPLPRVAQLEAPNHSPQAAHASAPAALHPAPRAQPFIPDSSLQSFAAPSRQYSSEPRSGPELLAESRHPMETPAEINAAASAHTHNQVTVPPAQHVEALRKPPTVAGTERPNRPERHEQKEARKNPHTEKGNEVPT